MVTRPLSSCMAARIRASTRSGFCAAPPNRPECRSRSAQVSLHLLVDEPAQRRRHHRGRRVPHAGVADQRQVELELVRVVLDEAEQVVGAALLLALDHHGDRQRQLAGHRLEGAARLDEGHHLAFVVAGSARNDDLAAVGQRRDARRERRRLPQIERIDRLHVVMAIEQHARALPSVSGAALADDDRVPVGRPHAGLEADAGQSPWPQTRPRPGTRPCRPDRSRSTGCAGSRTAARGSGRDRRRSSEHGRKGLRGGHVMALALSCFERGHHLRDSACKQGGMMTAPQAIEFNDRLVRATARRILAARCPWSRARWRGRPSCPSCRRATCRCRRRSGRRPCW